MFPAVSTIIGARKSPAVLPQSHVPLRIVSVVFQRVREDFLLRRTQPRVPHQVGQIKPDHLNEGRMMPFMIVFWAKIKTSRVGTAASVRAAIMTYWGALLDCSS